MLSYIWLWWWETLSAMIYGSGGGILSVLSYIWLWWWETLSVIIYGSGGGRLSVLSYIWLWWWKTLSAMIYGSDSGRISAITYGSGGGRLPVPLSYTAIVVVDSVLSYMGVVAGDSQCYRMALVVAIVVGDSMLSYIYSSCGGRLSAIINMALIVVVSVLSYILWLWWWETLGAIICNSGGGRLLFYSVSLSLPPLAPSLSLPHPSLSLSLSLFLSVPMTLTLGSRVSV